MAPAKNEKQSALDAQALAQAMALTLAQVLPQQGNKSGGFKGTTEGQLTLGLVFLGAVLAAISALAPVHPSVADKLLAMAEQLWTYVPISYALSRGLAKGGLPIPGLGNAAAKVGKAAGALILAAGLILTPAWALAAWGDEAEGTRPPAVTTAPAPAPAKAQPAPTIKLTPEILQRASAIAAQLQGQTPAAQASAAAQTSGTSVTLEQLQQKILELEKQLNQKSADYQVLQSQGQARNMLRQGWMLGMDTVAALRLAGYDPDNMKGARMVTGANGQQMLVIPGVNEQQKKKGGLMEDVEEIGIWYLVISILVKAGLLVLL